MIESLWFKQPNTWVGKLGHKLALITLWPLSRLFDAIAQKRRRAYQSGKKPSYRASVPVVVVGNISVGGNGKTPVVIFLVEALQALGYKVGVVSRGYGGKAQYPLTVTQITSANQSGDEPLLIFKRTGADVVVDPNRSQAVQVLESMDVDIVITDDGLQHYALQRDIELIVIDGKRRFGNGHTLPLGPLRESTQRLQEVDFLITNGGIAQVGEISLSLAPDLAVNLMTGERRQVSELGELVAMAGIGHPPRFFDTLTALDANLVATHPFADHQAFDIDALKVLTHAPQNLIMTEKDAVKCQGFAQSNWWYLPVSAQINSASQQQIIEKIQEVIKDYGSPSA